MAELTALRAEVCGSATNNRSVYDNWNCDWNNVDLQNKDYHSFYYSAGHRTEMNQGLEIEIFMMMMVSRAIYEEHLCARLCSFWQQEKCCFTCRKIYYSLSLSLSLRTHSLRSKMFHIGMEPFPKRNGAVSWYVLLAAWWKLFKVKQTTT